MKPPLCCSEARNGGVPPGLLESSRVLFDTQLTLPTSRLRHPHTSHPGTQPMGDALVGILDEGHPRWDAPRRKTTQSCDPCREKRVKCDQSEMSIDGKCERCASCGINCTFLRVPAKRGPAKGSLPSVYSRVTRLEDMLKAVTAAAQEGGNISAILNATTRPPPIPEYPRSSNSIRQTKEYQFDSMDMGAADIMDRVDPEGDATLNDSPSQRSQGTPGSTDYYGSGTLGEARASASPPAMPPPAPDSPYTPSPLPVLRYPSYPQPLVSAPASDPTQPPLSVFMTLLPLYFKFVGPHIPCIHPATFFSQALVHRQSNPFLINAMFSLTAAFYPHAQPSSPVGSPPHSNDISFQTFHMRARSLVLGVLEASPCIENVWGLIHHAMAYATCGNSNIRAADMYLGAALAMSKALGLDFDSHADSEQNTAAWVHAEQRRRTYHVLWKLDTVFGPLLQRSFLIETSPLMSFRPLCDDRLFMPEAFRDKPLSYMGFSSGMDLLTLSEVMSEMRHCSTINPAVHPGGEQDLERQIAALRESLCKRVIGYRQDLFYEFPTLPRGRLLLLNSGLIAVVEDDTLAASGGIPGSAVLLNSVSKQYLYEYAGDSVSSRLGYHALLSMMLPAERVEERVENAVEAVTMIANCVDACKRTNLGWVDLGFPMIAQNALFLASDLLSIHHTQRQVPGAEKMVWDVVEALEGFGKRWPYSFKLAEILRAQVASL